MLIFSVTNVSISSSISSTPEIHPSVSCILLVMPASVVPVHLPRFFIYTNLSVFSVLIQVPFSGLEQFYPYASTVWLISLTILAFPMVFTHSHFKDLYYLHKVCFKVFFSSFTCVGIGRPAGVVYLSHGGDIWPLLLFAVFLCWNLDVCVWSDFR